MDKNEAIIVHVITEAVEITMEGISINCGARGIHV